jgi:hypothetical protein
VIEAEIFAGRIPSLACPRMKGFWENSGLLVVPASKIRVSFGKV